MIRAEKKEGAKHTRASLEVEKARIEREEAERQLIEAKRQFKGNCSLMHVQIRKSAVEIKLQHNLFGNLFTKRGNHVIYLVLVALLL